MSDFLNKNIKAIEKKNSRLSKWIMDGPDEDWCQEYRHDDGFVNLVWTSGQESIPLHPLKCSLEKILRSMVEQNWQDDHFSILLGIGLGHRVKVILDIMEPVHRLFVVEASAYLYRRSMSLYDFSAAIGDGRLVLAYPDEQGIDESLSSLPITTLRHEPLFCTEAYVGSLVDIYEDLVAMTYHKVRSTGNNIITQQHKGLRTSLNLIRSLPRQLASPGVTSHDQSFKGVPAIVVCPGPSLAKNVSRFREAKGKALVLSTAQSLPMLLAHDVEPDAIMVIDGHPGHIKSVLDGLLDSDQIPLIAVGRASAYVVSNWQGATIISAFPGSMMHGRHWLNDLKIRQGDVALDLSVAHYALRLADYWQCGSITLVGQDLSFGDEGVYHEQYNFEFEAMDGEPEQSISSGHHDSTGHDHKIYEDQHVIEGYYSHSVSTSNQWYDQREVLQKVIGQTKARVFNSTEGGAMIKGAEPMSLDRFIKTHCLDFIDTSCLSKPKTVEERQTDIKAILPELLRDANRLEKVARRIGKGLDFLARADQEAEGSMECLSHLGRYREIKLAIAKHLKSLPLLAAADLGAQLASADADELATKDNKETTQIQITAGRTYLEASLKSTEKLTQSYNRSISTIRRYSESLSGLATRPEDPDVLAEAAEASIETGLVVEAADLYDQAMDIVPDRLDLIESAAALALKRDRFKQAEDLALRLEGLPKGKEAAKSIRLDVETALAGIIAGLEDELEQELYVRPINQTRKYLKARPGDAQVKSILDRAIALRDEKTTKAETEHQEFLASLEKEKRKQSYDSLVADSREIGQKGDFAASLKMLEEAQALIPELKEASWGIATALTQLGRLDEALEAYEGLMARFPGNLRLSFELGMVMVRLGKLGEGAELITKAMATTDEFDGYLVHLAAHHRQLNRHDLALENYDRYLKRFPTDPQAWTMRGDCLAEMGQLDQAIGAYDTALSHQSGFVDAVNHKKTVQRVLAGGGG